MENSDYNLEIDLNNPDQTYGHLFGLSKNYEEEGNVFFYNHDPYDTEGFRRVYEDNPKSEIILLKIDELFTKKNIKNFLTCKNDFKRSLALGDLNFLAIFSNLTSVEISRLIASKKTIGIYETLGKIFFESVLELLNEEPINKFFLNGLFDLAGSSINIFNHFSIKEIESFIGKIEKISNETNNLKNLIHLFNSNITYRKNEMLELKREKEKKEDVSNYLTIEEIKTLPDDKLSDKIKAIKKLFLKGKVTPNKLLLDILLNIFQFRDSVFSEAGCYEFFESPMEGFSGNPHFSDMFIDLLKDSFSKKEIDLSRQLLDLFCVCFSDIQRSGIGPDVPEYYGSKGCDIVYGLKNISEENGDSIDFFTYEKIKEIIDMLFGNNMTDKPGFLHGVSGGASNKTIYAFQNTYSSFKTRKKHNYYQGFHNGTPVFPISVGFIGEFKKGKLHKIFKEIKKGSIETKSLYEDLVGQNDEKYEYIYSELESFHNPDSDPRAGDGLSALNSLWSLEKKIKLSGETFLFDVEKINPVKLHPFVYGNIFHFNNEILKERNNSDNKPHGLVEVTIEDYFKEVFPDAEVSKKDAELYFSFQSLHNRKVLEDSFGIDIGDFDFWTQRTLIEYLSSQSWDKIIDFSEKIKISDIKKEILFCFIACSQEISMGDIILELINHLPKSEEIFRVYYDLIQLRGEFNDNNSEVLFQFQTIIKRANKLLKKSLQSLQNNENFSIQQGYSKKIVEVGSRVKGLLIKEKNEGSFLSQNEFNELSTDFSISMLTGDPTMFHGTDMLDMADEDNYIEPENFSKADYQMLYDNLTRTYGKIDEAWLGVLHRGIAKDLCNPGVKFYLMREKDTGKLVGMCKTKKTEKKDELYIGSHYVEPEYQGDFGFGEYIMGLAMHDSKNIDIFTGAVAVNNPALERHINYGGFYIDGITHEEDDKGKGGPGFIVHVSDKIFKTKNKKLFPDEYFKNNRNGEGYEVKIIDTSPENNEAYLDKCQEYFNAGYSITRLFYLQGNKGADLTQTCIVFEK